MGTRLLGYKKGFTIVELLIVIVVIAILAAITIVAYNGITARANTSADVAGLNQINQKIQAYIVDNSAPPADLSSLNISSGNTNYQYSVNTSVTPNTWGVTATTGSISYYISSTNQTPTAGGYAGHGVGGVAAITNMAANPGAEIGTTVGSTPNNAVITASTDWAAHGTYSYMITPNNASSGDSYFTIGGDQGGFRAGMIAGNTYTVSATIHVSVPLTGTINGNGPRAITVWYTSSTGTIGKVNSTSAPNTVGDTRLSATLTIPSTAVGAWIRLYNGATSGNGIVSYDDIMITQGSTIYNYADPDTNSNWVWSGTPRNSTSTGPVI